jgi:hypothetical protein
MEATIAEYNQTVNAKQNPMSSLSSGHYGLNLSETCTNCSLGLTIRCEHGSTFYFGGVLFPSVGSLLPPCNQSLSLNPPDDWLQFPLTKRQSSFSHHCYSQPYSYVTNSDGASAFFSFNGTGVIVSGFINDTSYNVVCPHPPA